MDTVINISPANYSNNAESLMATSTERSRSLEATASAICKLEAMDFSEGYDSGDGLNLDDSLLNSSGVSSNINSSSSIIDMFGDGNDDILGLRLNSLPSTSYSGENG